MWLIVKARRGAEDLAVRVHELVLVSPDVHGVHCSFQQVQALVAGGLQAVLGRQVGPQGAGEARMVAQVATLGPDNKKNPILSVKPKPRPWKSSSKGEDEMRRDLRRSCRRRRGCSIWPPGRWSPTD